MKFEWQHVLKLPFIQTDELLSAVAAIDGVPGSLSADEQGRNVNAGAACIHRGSVTFVDPESLFKWVCPEAVGTAELASAAAAVEMTRTPTTLSMCSSL